MSALQTALKTNLSSCREGQMPCFYVNATSQIQVIRVNHFDHIILEKVLFPGFPLRFEAWPDDHLEVNTYDCITTILEDTIPCQRLAIA